MIDKAYPWPPLLLALLTLLALAAAYSVRPLAQIDLGDYYDSAYLDGFHAREIDSAGAGQSWAWPVDANETSLPGGLSGDWMITVQADDSLPGRPASGVALSVNDNRVGTFRRSSHSFSSFVPARLAAAPLLKLAVHGTPTGSPDPPAGTMKQVLLEPARTYRWTSDESTITLPGLGRGAWRVDLDLVTAHPDGQPLQATVLVNDSPLAALPDSDRQRRFSLLVPAEYVGSGTLKLTLRSNTYDDPRPLGMLLAEVQVAPLGRSGLASLVTLLPPTSTLAASLIIVLALYACLALLCEGTTHPLRYWLAALVVLAAAVGGAWALAVYRFPFSLMLPKLAGLAIWSLLLLLALRPLLRRAVAGSRSFSNALLLIFFLSYWIKAGGMLYPYFVGIDISWHMERVRWILDGQLPLLYGTSSPLNESTMPVAEWGEEPPVIPYSPYFHIFAASFALLPWRLELSASLFGALVDCSRILIIALLACRVGSGQRVALLAALLLGMLPVTFLLHSWGNIPTTFGLWWTFIMTVWIVLAWPRLHERRPFAVLTLLILAALLFYTVTGAFAGLFLGCFTLALGAAAWRSKQTHLLAGLRPLWLAAVLALLLALLLYYGQYIPPIIERTLPYFAQAFTAGPAEGGRVTDSWPDYLMRHTRLAGYGLVVPLLLTLVYLGWEWYTGFRHSASEPAARPGALLLWAAVAGWAMVMLLFIPLGYKISMVDKHFFVAVPFLTIASAAMLDRLWARGRVGQGITLLYLLYLMLAGLDLWLMRITSVQQG